MNIRCAHCKGRHESIAQLKICAGVGPRISRQELDAQNARAKAAPKIENFNSEWADTKPRGITEDGMYMMGDHIFKVQFAVHGSGRLYAKRLVPPTAYAEKATFEYAPGIVKQLTPEHKMTLEQAKEFGALYGTCCVCGRTLTNEGSIENGIGPICASKF